MAETKGLVQRITMITDTLTCVWIGANPTNVEALLVTHDGTRAGAAFAATMVQALTSASCNYREVVAVHGDNNARITSVRIEPV